MNPIHIRQYLDWRIAQAKSDKLDANKRRAAAGKKPLVIRGDEGKVRANREIAWLSAAWNWARDKGLTTAQNPTAGVKRHKEPGRSIYVEDDEMQMIMAQADEPLKEAIQLAYLIGQRPSDLRKISESDIRDGYLMIVQNKTGAKQRIEVTGELAALIEKIKARKAKIAGVRSMALICNEEGSPLLKAGLRYRFDRAREAAAEAADTETAKKLRSIQFRDLRAKAASDVESLSRAQALLGHTTRNMTERYVRQRRGDKVSPVK